jgi:hypothetical protein
MRNEPTMKKTDSNLKKTIAQGIWEQKNQEEALKWGVILGIIALTGIFAGPSGWLIAIPSGFFSFIAFKYALGGIL